MHAHSGAHGPAPAPALERLGVHSETQTLTAPRVPTGKCPGWEAPQGCSPVDFVGGAAVRRAPHTERPARRWQAASPGPLRLFRWLKLRSAAHGHTRHCKAPAPRMLVAAAAEAACSTTEF